MNVSNGLCIALAIVALALLWRGNNLSHRLELEQAGHELTTAKLYQALSDGQRWARIAGEIEQSVESQKQNAEACLRREAQARADADARKAILVTTKPRPRADGEKVVDDETRVRAVARLNRPL